MKPTQLALATICVFATTADAQQTISATCLLQPAEQVTLSSSREGVISKIHVRPGETVRPGDVLIEIDKQQSLAELNVAKTKYSQAVQQAKSNGNALVAQSAIKRAETELGLLERVGRVPFLEKFRVENDRERSQSELTVAQEDRAVNQEQVKVRRAELDLAQLDTDERIIRSKLDGAVVRQLKYEGEYAERGVPILKIVQLDVLLVQGLISVNEIPPHQLVDQRASFSVQLKGEKPIRIDDLNVQRVSPETDLDGNYTFWIRIPNVQRSNGDGDAQWVLRPGMRGHLEIEMPIGGEMLTNTTRSSAKLD